MLMSSDHYANYFNLDQDFGCAFAGKLEPTASLIAGLGKGDEHNKGVLRQSWEESVAELRSHSIRLFSTGLDGHTHRKSMLQQSCCENRYVLRLSTTK